MHKTKSSKCVPPIAQRHATSAECHNARQFQFRLRTILFFVAYLSVAFGSVRLVSAIANRFEKRFDVSLISVELFFPGWIGVCAWGLLLFAIYRLVAKSDSEAVWSVLALAWLVIALDLFYGILREFIASCESDCFQPVILQFEVFYVTTSVTVLPMLVTVPVVYTLIARQRSTPRAIYRWTKMTLLVAIIDAVVVVVFLWYALEQLAR